MPSWDAITAGVKIGTVNYVYTDDINSALTGSGAAVGSAPLNHLLFVGINSSAGATADPKVRQAIASVIDRDKMVSDVYGGKGTAAALPYREGMGLGELPDGFETDTERANTLLDEAGFTEKDTYDVRQTNGGALTFEILVPQDSAYKVVAANTLVEQLRACGVKATVTGVDDATYTDRIAKGNFQLYIGEIVLESNLDLTPFFGGGAASYGIVLPDEFKAAYDAFLNSADSYGEYAAQFAQAMPLSLIHIWSGSSANACSISWRFAASCCSPAAICTRASLSLARCAAISSSVMPGSWASPASSFFCCSSSWRLPDSYSAMPC